MLKKLHWLGHAGFYIEGPKGIIIYIDPYHIKHSQPKADILLISHAHFDHCSLQDIKKIIKDDTVIIGPARIVLELPYPVKVLSPGEDIKAKGILVEAVCSYNPRKNFHPKEEGNLGFVITVNNTRIYHAGDTDFIPEMKKIKADIALMPVGGTYTMNSREAAEAVNLINPKIAVPMHFVNTERIYDDIRDFQNLCKVEVKVLDEEK